MLDTDSSIAEPTDCSVPNIPSVLGKLAPGCRPSGACSMWHFVFRVRTARVSLIGPQAVPPRTSGNIADYTQLPFGNDPLGICPGPFTSIPPNLSGRHRRAKIAELRRVWYVCVSVAAVPSRHALCRVSSSGRGDARWVAVTRICARVHLVYLCSRMG